MGVKVGEQVNKNQALAILRSGFGDFELNSPIDGKIKKIYVTNDDRVEIGEKLFEIEEKEEDRNVKTVPRESEMKYNLQSNQQQKQQRQNFQQNEIKNQFQRNNENHLNNNNNIPFFQQTQKTQPNQARSYSPPSELESFFKSPDLKESYFGVQNIDFQDHLDLLRKENIYKFSHILKMNDQDWKILHEKGFYFFFFSHFFFYIFFFHIFFSSKRIYFGRKIGIV